MIHHGDCLEVMPSLLASSVDAVVTDPPYGLGFMGKHWDRGVPGPDFWAEMLRVAKPSAYLLAFGGTRTVHRIATSIEDAGWIIRDMLVWAYASGFPKSKASLKPAWEPIVMARKPGPLRDLAIDACRIGRVEGDRTEYGRDHHLPHANVTASLGAFAEVTPYEVNPSGRWPANVILTDPIFDGGIEGVVGGGRASDSPSDVTTPNRTTTHSNLYGGGRGLPNNETVFGYGDSGTYSRFFLIPKADRAEREPIGGMLERTSEGDGTTTRNARCAVCRKVKFASDATRCHCDRPVWEPSSLRANVHPTVKPVDLMRHLVRLVTPSGGVVLDPFLGSGTTGIACEMEGFDWIGIEREAEYVRIAEARLVGVQRGFGLSA